MHPCHACVWRFGGRSISCDWLGCVGVCKSLIGYSNKAEAHSAGLLLFTPFMDYKSDATTLCIIHQFSGGHSLERPFYSAACIRSVEGRGTWPQPLLWQVVARSVARGLNLNSSLVYGLWVDLIDVVNWLGGNYRFIVISLWNFEFGLLFVCRRLSVCTTRLALVYSLFFDVISHVRIVRRTACNIAKFVRKLFSARLFFILHLAIWFFIMDRLLVFDILFMLCNLSMHA